MRLAKKWGNRMTGIYVLSKPYLAAYAEAKISADIIEAQAKEMEKVANRAHEALPILKDAKTVTIMESNPKIKGNGAAEPAAGLARHLAEHGIKAAPDHVTTDMDPGNMLLSRAADKSVDLIVMGAYGHSR